MNWFRQVVKKREEGRKKREEAAVFSVKSPSLSDLFFNDGGKRGCGGRYRASRGQRRGSPRYQSRLQSFFSNDCAGLLTGDGLCREEAGVCQRLPLRKLSLSYLLISLCYFNRNRKFFKEIACQPNGKNSFAQAGYDFGNKFPAGIINDRFHQLDDSMNEKRCQWAFGGTGFIPEAEHELV
mgnify:CR=1 FL=1